MLNLGAHFSISGGLHKALSEAALLECRALQIFTRNQNQWKAKPLTEEGIALFRSERERLGIETILAHDSYLINLGSPESILSKRSLNAFIEEIERAELLDIQFLVFHPGSHMGSGEVKCVERIAQALNRAIETHEDYNVTLLLENTAGQGTSVGWRFEHLGEIISMIDRPERMGVCFDTSHAFAAGYELRTEDGYENTWQEFDRCIGLEKLGAFHLNDSKKILGSRVDRHEHIGHGYIGSKPFEYILNDERFDGLAGCLETPKEGDWDRQNLLTLRRLEHMQAATKKTGCCGSSKPKTAAKRVTARKAAPKKATARKVVKKKVVKKIVKKAAPKKKVVKKIVKKAAPKKKVTARKPAARKKTAAKKVTPKRTTTRRVARKK